MTDEALLFGVLCLVYLTDCFIWVDYYSCSFVTWTGKKWMIENPISFLETSRGGLIFTNPISPLGNVFTSHMPPLCLSPYGIVSFNGPKNKAAQNTDADYKYIDFKSISKIEVADRDIKVDQEKFLRFQTAHQADKAGSLLNDVTGTSIDEREGVIRDFLNESLDLDHAKTIFEQCNHDVRLLKILCNILFFYLFLFSPIIISFTKIVSLLIPIACGMFIIAIQICIEFFSLHKKYFPSYGEERITSLIKMILCPPVSIKSMDLITKDLLGSYNPIVLGKLLLSHKEFNELYEKTVRHLKYPVFKKAISKKASRVIIWQNQLLLKMLPEIFGRSQISPSDFVAVPDTKDVRSYCPRCLCQFTSTGGECPDCQGIKLVGF